MHERVVLFGGPGASGRDDETWVYNYTDNTWTNMNPSPKPSAREAYSMVYDSAHDRVVLFGGLDGIRDGETWVYSDYKVFQQGLFTSKVNSFDSISTITGNISWTPVGQQTGTSLKVQIGFSNTPDEADFYYIPLQSTNFTFEINTNYVKYRVAFESSDFWQLASPLLNKTTLSYTLETISNEANDDDDTRSDYWIIPGIIGATISCGATLGIIGIVFYSKKKAVRT